MLLFYLGWVSQGEGDSFLLVLLNSFATNKAVFFSPFEIDGFEQKEDDTFFSSTAKFVYSSRHGKQ